MGLGEGHGRGRISGQRKGHLCGGMSQDNSHQGGRHVRSEDDEERRVITETPRGDWSMAGDDALG